MLWVDDQPDLVAPQITAIAAGMQGEGFEFRPIQCQSLDETQEFLSGDVFNDEIDLVLVDWNLGGGVRASKQLRRSGRTSNTKTWSSIQGIMTQDELRRLAFKSGLEATTQPDPCSSRGDKGVQFPC